DQQQGARRGRLVIDPVEGVGGDADLVRWWQRARLCQQVGQQLGQQQQPLLQQLDITRRRLFVVRGLLLSAFFQKRQQLPQAAVVAGDPFLFRPAGQRSQLLPAQWDVVLIA